MDDSSQRQRPAQVAKEGNAPDPSDVAVMELARQAAKELKEASMDPRCDWSDMGEEERESMKRKCEALFDWFSRLPVKYLSDLSACVDDIYGEKMHQHAFDLDLPKYILERFEEAKALDFEAEFSLEHDALIVALMYGIQEEKNSVDVDFAIICKDIGLDRGTYHVIKRKLRDMSEQECNPKKITLDTLATPVDLCVCITIAQADVCKWPMTLDWSKVVFPDAGWTMQNVKEFKDSVANASRLLWGATPADRENMKKIEDLNAEMDRDMAEMEKLLAELNKENERVNIREEAAILKDARVELNREREKALLEICPDSLRDQPKLSDKDLDEILAETQLAQKQLEVLYGQSRSGLPLNTRLALEPGMVCLAAVDCASGTEFVEARVVQKEGADKYLVELLEQREGFPVRETVSNAEIASVEVPIYDADIRHLNYSGLRVAALTNPPFSLDPPQWFIGTVASYPLLKQEHELLIFFDDGFDGYVSAPLEPHLVNAMEATSLNASSSLDEFRKKINILKVLPMCSQCTIQRSRQADEELNKGYVHTLVRGSPDRVRFIEHYFAKYPDWPLLRMKTCGNTIQTVNCLDSTNIRRATVPVFTYRVMCVLRFPASSSAVPGWDCYEYPCTRGHIHNDEWVFRGSNRISAVALDQMGGSNNMSSRRIAKNRLQFDLVEPTQMADLSENEDMETDRTDKAIVQNMLTVARKSSIPSVLVKGRRGRRTENENAMAKKKEREKMFTVRDRSPPNLPAQPMAYHGECSRDCLQGRDKNPYDAEFRYTSPLYVPIACGWTRLMYNYEMPGKQRGNDVRILYRAPCGRSFPDGTSIGKFIKETSSQLTVDLFSFEPAVNIFSVAEVPSKYVLTEDFTGGLERIPIAAVNTIDKEQPPDIIYGSRRFPYDDRVDVSTLSSNFCSGCTCTDDCSDATRCECQQLTRNNVNRLDRSFRPTVYGYENRYLTQKTISGIFECNENCSCNRQCFNRVVQNPLKYPIQMYKTAQCGWGVRCLVDIPRGAFIANYVGALMTDGIADELTTGDDAYFADLDLNDAVEFEKASTLEVHGHLDLGFGSSEDEDEANSAGARSDDDGVGSSDYAEEDSDDDAVVARVPKKKSKRRKAGGEEKVKEPLRKQVDEYQQAEQADVFKWMDYFGEKNSLYVIDAKNKGNVGRFLNHSCEPNVIVQHVLVDTHDLRLPWTAFFACKNIKAGEELCWDYGYQQMDDRPQHLQVHCACGSSHCKGRLL